MSAHHSIQGHRSASVRPCNIGFTRRYFIFTAASVAGGLMVGIGAVPRRPTPPLSRGNLGTTTTRMPQMKSMRG
jgi:hypothetical protein